MLEMFKDLTISGSEKQLDEFLKIAASQLPGGWSRDMERENELEKTSLGTNDYQYAFSHLVSDDIPKTTLFLIRENDCLRATNIVPHDVSQISRAQYNSILDSFVEHVVRKNSERVGLTWEITSDRLPISNWLSEKAEKQLRAFSSSANKGSGSSHPMDFKRWTEFLAQVHREGRQLGSETLRRWLIEEEGWPEETAVDLAIEFEFAVGLLQAYDPR